MHSRRLFIKQVGSGLALSSVAISPLGYWVFDKMSIKKSVRIGIIGAENHRTLSFARTFNIDKSFPGVEVKYVWGETKELAEIAMSKGSIPFMVEEPTDMLGKIDALIVAHRHPKYHLEAARPFVKAGIPTFIEKPFCYRLAEGKAFLKWAEEIGTPVCSYSSVAHTEETFALKEQLKAMGNINNIVRYGPADFDSEYGGFFYYGVHLLQPLMYMIGDDIIKVRVTHNQTNGIVNLVFANGQFATLVLKSQSKGWNTFVETDHGVIELKADVPTSNPGRKYTDLVTMFRTGQLPRSHDSILKCVATLEAIEKSAKTESWENVEKV